MGKVFDMAGAAHENLLAPLVVDDAWVDNRSSPVDRESRGCWYDWFSLLIRLQRSTWSSSV